MLVVAKDDRAHLGLAGQFTVHSVERVYRAIVWGVPGAAQGRSTRPIGRHPQDRKRMAVVRAAASGPSPVAPARGGRASRRPARVPARDRPHPSDPRPPRRSSATRCSATGSTAPRPRGAAPSCGRRRLDRMLLHARRLGFDAPDHRRARCASTSPPPADMRRHPCAPPRLKVGSPPALVRDAAP